VIWKWNWKIDWILLFAIGAGVAVSLYLLKNPNPDPTNARYILSTIPETIGTIFVITIAVMQILGNLDLKKFVKRPEFLLPSLTTLICISASLIILYRNAFCKWTAICLGCSIGNLIIIGWFIVRVIRAKDSLRKSQFEDLPPEELKERAMSSLQLYRFSTLVKIIKEYSRRIQKLFTGTQDDQSEARNMCFDIKQIALHEKNTFSEVWDVAVKNLFLIDEKALQENTAFSVRTSFPLLHSVIRKLPIANPFNRLWDAIDWEPVRDHYVNHLRKDLEEGLITLSNIAAAGFKRHLDSLDAIIALAFDLPRKHSIIGVKYLMELKERVLPVLKEAEPSKLNPDVAFAYAFRIIADLILTSPYSAGYYSHLQDVVDMVEIPTDEKPEKYLGRLWRKVRCLYYSDYTRFNPTYEKPRIKEGVGGYESQELNEIWNQFKVQLMKARDNA